jgi:fluoride exporter
MKLFWAVAVGAALGGVARYALGSAIQSRAGTEFPVGILTINVVGSLVLGFALSAALGSASEPVKLFLTTGFCGGFTTFSTFSYETVVLLQQGRIGKAAAYVGLSVGLSLIATWTGFLIGGQGRAPAS